MSVAKVIELVGQSDVSWDDAARNAVSRAGQTVDDISGIEVLNFTARVEEGEIRDYKVDVKLIFGVKDED